MRNKIIILIKNFFESIFILNIYLKSLKVDKET